ncbi:DUF2812 domain-containing protein [Jeotgalibacillus sp. S-D1]|uniref:DUF2812 domain-containing protein n=1 Tax=Jeotgalibacillus sp. S-D1 TaxID=2552189 RepID=UPI00105A30E5|nr:DUF2812 domain-containing protein [Jeotgalibacillus sp. S-D1]TDL34219.1 DUF2812 domain-containing protein [Jeotgalibacillus sp. S-D1]
MGKTKFIMSGGLAFDEEKDMERLAKLARKGWKFDRFAFMGYRLKKAEHREVQYSLDYCTEADSDYFSYFEEAGWDHVGSSGNYIHLFCASKGTAPIYSDRETTIEKYDNEKKMMKKWTLIMLLVTFSFMIFLFTFNSFPVFSNVKAVMNSVLTIMLGLSLIGLIFTGLPYLGYLYRVNKLRRHG